MGNMEGMSQQVNVEVVSQDSLKAKPSILKKILREKNFTGLAKRQ